MFYFDWTFFILIPAIILTFIAQAKVKMSYGSYSKVPNSRGITGAEAARRILDSHGMTDVPVERVGGELSDHYDPGSRTVRLSARVYDEPSIASVAVAAHECGHAVQHQSRYGLLVFRNAIAGPVNVISMASWPLIVIGIFVIEFGYHTGGNLLFNIGVIAFGAIVLFHLVTLPVEVNASSRAIKELQADGLILEEDVRGTKKVLTAAALTYVAALAAALAQLFRLLLIRGDD